MLYILKPSLDSIEIGHYPQCNGVAKPYNFRAAYSIWKIDYSKPIDFDIRIPPFKLYNQAKWTDYITSNAFKSGASILCTSTFFSLLQQFKLPSYQQYNTQIEKENVKKGYNFIYFSEIHNHYVDFEKSTFYVRYVFNKDRPQNRQLIRFQSIEDYNRKEQKLYQLAKGKQSFMYHQLFFKKNMIQFDLFRLYGFYQGLIISERLKNALNESSLTGFRCQPFEELSLKPFSKNQIVIPPDSHS